MIKLVNDKNLANAITHAGSFHADDIFSTIFLSRLQDIYLFRTNEVKEEDFKNKIVFDIGGKKFDHHGEHAKIRDSGIKYSAFGLLFEAYGKEYLKKQNVEDINCCYDMFLKEFILQIDAIDNGIFPEKKTPYNISTLSEIIEYFNPTWKEETESNIAFLEGIKIGELLFERIERRIFDKLMAKDFIEEKIKTSKDHVLILEKYMPFMDYVVNNQTKAAKEIFFAIYPSRRGGFNIQAIKKEPNSHQNRVDFPKEWGGKTKEELVSLTKVETFHFCHAGLFLCACDTLEDARKIANIAI